MNKAKLIDGMIKLPHKFNTSVNISVYDILLSIGYFEHKELITLIDIRDALVICQECIDEWFDYSEDKRTNSGWYLKRENDDNYIVGHLPENKCFVYSNRLDACAAFIKLECESIETVNIFYNTK